jgi:hypothetical protein
MAANSLAKQIQIAWEEMLVSFDDALVLSKAVDKYNVPGQEFQRSSDVMWRNVPVISISGAGIDATTDFTNSSVTQLSVPSTLGFSRHSVFNLTGLELRDALTEGTLLKGAKQKLASDINVSLNDTVSLQGSICIKRTVAATGFDDIAQMDATMNETGVPMFDRFGALSSRDYNGMASNLQGRHTINDLPRTAYEKALISSDVAGFQLLKMDYASRLTLAAGVTVTTTGLITPLVPVSTTTQTDGSVTPKDNRSQVIGITVTSGTVKVGDRFTIGAAGLVNSVHAITKVDSGVKQTFVINAIVTGAGGTGTVSISPPIIIGSAQSQLQYQNVSSAPVSGATINFLNTASAPVNPFWQKGAVQIIPGKYMIPEGSGVQTLTGTTESGMTLSMSYFLDINTLTLKARVDCLWGTVMLQPSMAGCILFNQV